MWVSAIYLTHCISFLVYFTVGRVSHHNWLVIQRIVVILHMSNYLESLGTACSTFRLFLHLVLQFFSGRFSCTFLSEYPLFLCLNTQNCVCFGLLDILWCIVDTSSFCVIPLTYGSYCIILTLGSQKLTPLEKYHVKVIATQWKLRMYL